MRGETTFLLILHRSIIFTAVLLRSQELFELKFTEIKSNVKRSSSALLAAFEVLRHHMWLVAVELDSTDAEQCHRKSSWTVLVQGPSPPRLKSLGHTFLFLSQGTRYGIPFIPCLLCRDRGRVPMYENILFWAPIVLLSKDEGYFFAKLLASPTATRHCLQSVHLQAVTPPVSRPSLCPWDSSLGLGNGEPNPPKEADHPATDLQLTLFAKTDHFPRIYVIFPSSQPAPDHRTQGRCRQFWEPRSHRACLACWKLGRGSTRTPALTWPWTE